ncbi:hypothetical protein N7490_004880 [Penicillium lividum]|nr:hypothetical protein N7490_004880 [Penicillium lividum]
MAGWKANIKARKVGKAGTDETVQDEPTNGDQDGEPGSSQLVPVNLRPLDQRRFWTSAELEALDGRLLTLEAFYTAWAEQWVEESTGHLRNCDKGSQD